MLPQLGTCSVGFVPFGSTNLLDGSVVGAISLCCASMAFGWSLTLSSLNPGGAQRAAGTDSPKWLGPTLAVLALRRPSLVASLMDAPIRCCRSQLASLVGVAARLAHGDRSSDGSQFGETLFDPPAELALTGSLRRCVCCAETTRIRPCSRSLPGSAPALLRPVCDRFGFIRRCVPPTALLSVFQPPRRDDEPSEAKRHRWKHPHT